MRRPPPRFAEHTREILSELGYVGDAANDLIGSGAVVAQPEDDADSPF